MIGTRPEILAPVGDEERLRAALLYGADAVYLAGTSFGMRSAPRNFDDDGLHRAVEQAHRQGVKVYVTCNILPRNRDMAALPGFLESVQEAGVDAIIAADFGVIALCKRYAPHCRLHVSTQFGTVNDETARQLYELGASRVVLSRELSLEEIAEIRMKTPSALELECFVHGAMCMAYSGRCLLSAFMTGRSANQGDCAQPCRWKFHLTEENRPDKIWTAEEDGEGTYLFNANDLNMIEHVAALSAAGVDSFKIEGRAKAAYYVAVTTNAYRTAVEELAAAGCPADYCPSPWLVEELETISHRPYGTGFYFGPPRQATADGGYIRSWEVAAVVEGWQDGFLLLSQRNRFERGDELTVLEPGKPPVVLGTAGMIDGEGVPLAAACHPTMRVRIPYGRPLTVGSYLRKKA